MQLRLAITDLYGTVTARLDRFTQAKVSIPWNDARTAGVTLSVFDVAAAQALALERMLKVWLARSDGTSEVIFWGPIVLPTWQLHENTVQIDAQDMSVRLKHHYLNAGDAAVSNPGEEEDDFRATVPVSFVGMRRLRDAAKNRDFENDDGVPDLGIVNGSNTHPGATRVYNQTTTRGSNSYPGGTLNVVDASQFDKSGNAYIGGTVGGPPDFTVTGYTQTIAYTGKTGDSLTGVTGYSGSGTITAGTSVIQTGGEVKRMRTSRGDNVWDKIQELAQLPDGPDFELQPYEGAQPVDADGLNESTDVPKTIAAAGSFQLKATSTITVTDPGVFADAHVSVWIERSETEDVSLYLVTPAGAKLRLVDRNAMTTSGADFGTSSAGADRTIFDDNASNAIEDGTPPYDSFFRPNRPISNLRGGLVAGTWKLEVWAASTASAGTLHNWAINFIALSVPPPTPAYAKLNTYAKTDYSAGGPKDKRSSCLFTYGYGRDNVAELTYAPAGDSVRNRVVAVTANTGADGGTDPAHTRVKKNPASLGRYGVYVKWEAAGDLHQAASPGDVLNDIAIYWVESLSYPPQAIELTPKVSPASGIAPGLLDYLSDYRCGDLVRVSARWGHVSMIDPLTGDPVDYVDVMIREVGVEQTDEDGNVQFRLTTVPFQPAPDFDAGEVDDA